MKRIFILLGPDRVGKSTLIKELYDLISNNYRVETLHFSGPKPGHINPIMQYLAPLSQVKPSTQFLLLDRGHYETSFYELVRRGTHIDDAYVRTVDLTIRSMGIARVFLIHRVWDDVLPLHEEELAKGNVYPFDINARKEEHYQYYAHMEAMRASSVLPWTIINPIPYKESSPDQAKLLAEDIFAKYGHGYPPEYIQGV